MYLSKKYTFIYICPNFRFEFYESLSETLCVKTIFVCCRQSSSVAETLRVKTIFFQTNGNGNVDTKGV